VLIERTYDIAFVADQALREKQVQQNYRPVIAVHKWFARRPGTLFRSVLLSEFVDRPLPESFYSSNNLGPLLVADPFMGGGTPLLEANRVGCNVMGWDINPMAFWVVRQELAQLDLSSYREAAESLRAELRTSVGPLYLTQCAECGSVDADVKYFIWVKTQVCDSCGGEISLFPRYLLAEDKRHVANVFICSICGTLNESRTRAELGKCRTCGSGLREPGPAVRNRCACPHCGRPNRYPDPAGGPPRHRLVAIEYHCPRCRDAHQGRFFKKPDASDLAKLGQADEAWASSAKEYVPDDLIPPGDETDRLLRWGYRTYSDLFSARQLLGLQRICALISVVPDPPVREALATNLSDLLRYQNMLCRYDTMALKSQDVFSVHGFPVSLVQCESNLIGIRNPSGLNIGSGGWSNILDKYLKAKEYCQHPFETRLENGGKRVVPVPGEWIGAANGRTQDRQATVSCADATAVVLPEGTLDAVLTDPPYSANVQYAELMDFCYVWLRRLLAGVEPCFASSTTRNSHELTVNQSMKRDLTHFAEGLSSVFVRMARALKPGAPLVFTFHHNQIMPYCAVAVSLLDSGMVASAALPCPAEMTGSIHIRGTGSSIVDSVFVCRSTGRMPRRWLADSPASLAELVASELVQLEAARVKPTKGDARCIISGHLTRLAVWHLRDGWNREAATVNRLEAVKRWIDSFGGVPSVENELARAKPLVHVRLCGSVREGEANYGEGDADLPF